MSIKGAVDQIFKEIEKLNKELSDLRESCKHRKTTPQMFSYGLGRLHPTLICDDCRHTVLGITEDQTKKVWEKWGMEFNL